VRRDVEQQDVALLVGQRRALDRRAERDDLVRMNALARLKAKELGDRQLDAEVRYFNFPGQCRLPRLATVNAGSIT